MFEIHSKTEQAVIRPTELAGQKKKNERTMIQNMTKKNENKLDEYEILSEDGIFAVKHSTVFDNAEKCCQCGYAILPGEEALQIYVNGDVIHKECWQDYADENTKIFGKDFVCRDDSEVEF